MLRRTLLVILLLAVLFGCCVGNAQETRPVTFELNTDFRSRIASTGASRAALYDSQFGIHARLAPGLRFNYTGAQLNAPNLTGAGARFNRFITQDANIEKEWKTQRLQAGIIRIPFGIYDHRETYVSGLIDYPLARVDYALSALDWGTPGVHWTGLVSNNVQIDGAVFGGQSAGIWNNLNNVSGVAARLQTYTYGVVIGVSHWNGTQSSSFDHAGRQATQITGLDMRYTRPHLLVRGEYVLGKSAGDNMRGWYLDVYYHLPKYEKWTFAARIEEMRPQADGPLGRQITLGARYTLDSHWILAANWRRNNGSTFYGPSWTPGTGGGGDVFFQLYRKMSF